MDYVEMELRPLLDTMKLHLKKNDIKYKELADESGHSLGTITRLLNSHSISLKQLVHLCGLCGLTLSELIKINDNRTESANYMTEEQDEAFNEDPALQMYFTELFLWGRKPEEIEIRHNLSAAETVSYLRKLEKLNILRIGLNNTYTLLVRAPWGFRPGGRCMKSYGRRKMENLFGQVFQSAEVDSNTLLNIRELKLTEDQYKKLSKSLDGLLNRYACISHNQLSTELQATLYTVAALGGQFDDSESTIIAAN